MADVLSMVIDLPNIHTKCIISWQYHTSPTGSQYISSNIHGLSSLLLGACLPPFRVACQHSHLRISGWTCYRGPHLYQFHIPNSDILKMDFRFCNWFCLRSLTNRFLYVSPFFMTSFKHKPVCTCSIVEIILLFCFDFVDAYIYVCSMIYQWYILIYK